MNLQQINNNKIETHLGDQINNILDTNTIDKDSEYYKFLIFCKDIVPEPNVKGWSSLLVKATKELDDLGIEIQNISNKNDIFKIEINCTNDQNINTKAKDILQNIEEESKYICVRCGKDKLTFQTICTCRSSI